MRITENMLTHRDMFIIRRCVVIELGSFNKAALWSRIEFRAHEQNRDAVFADGYWWWQVTQEDMAEDLGLSARTVRSLLNALEDDGVIEVAEHSGNSYDHTKSYRCVVAGRDGQSDVEESSASDAEEIAESSLSLYEVDIVGGPKQAKKQAKTPVPLPDDWQPSQKLVEKAVALKVNWPQEVEKMRRWAFAKDVKRKDWDATFRSWIANARPTEEPIPTTVRTSGFRAWFASMLESANTGEVERVLGLVFPMPDEVPAGVSRVEFLDDCRRAWLESVEVQAESRWVVQFGDVLKGP